MLGSLPDNIIAVDETLSKKGLYFLDPDAGKTVFLKVWLVGVHSGLLEREGDRYVQDGISADSFYMLGNSIKNSRGVEYIVYAYQDVWKKILAKAAIKGYEIKYVSICHFCTEPESYRNSKNSIKLKIKKIFGENPPKKIIINEGCIEDAIDRATKEARWELEAKLEQRGNKNAQCLTLNHLEKIGCKPTKELMEYYQSKLAAVA